MAYYIRKKDTKKEAYRIDIKFGNKSFSKTWKPSPDMLPSKVKKEVEKVAILFEQECLQGKVTNKGNTKFVDFALNEFLPMKEKKLKYSTFKLYTNILNIYFIPMIGHIKMKNIDYSVIQQVVDRLCNTHIHKQNNELSEKYLSPSSVRRYYNVLHSVFSTAYKLGTIAVNPCDKDRIELPKLKKAKTNFLTEEELLHIYELLKDEKPQLQLIVHMAVTTGCRRGELVALKWSDIDFKEKTVNVEKSAYHETGAENNSFGTTKTDEIRKLALPDYLIDMLKQWKEQQKQLQLSLGDAWKGDNFIFIQADGKNMYYTTPTSMFADFLNKHHLKKHTRFHDLRHTNATISLMNGMDIKNVSARLGHTQLKTTSRYLHALESVEKEGANIFNNLYLSQENGEKTAKICN